MSDDEDTKLVLVHKLVEGMALLWYGPIPPEPGGKWVDAITDELARETGRFIGWFDYAYVPTLLDDGRRRRSAALTMAEARHRAKRWKRLAMYEDARSRRWVQREWFKELIRMIVKIENVGDGQLRIRTQDGSFNYVSNNSALVARLNGAKAAYFTATINKDVETLEIEERKHDQSW